MAINGIKIIVSNENGVIAGVKTDEIQTSAETIERSSPYTGNWRTYVTKRKEWGFSTSYLVMASSALLESGVTGLQDLLQVGKEYDIRMYDRSVGGDEGVIGKAILKKCKISASVGHLVKGSFEFVGNGELAAHIPVTGIVLNQTGITMNVGGSQSNPVSATITPDNATNKTLAWSSSDSVVATVTQDGDNYTVNAVAAGSCNLVASATDGSGVTASCGITVSLE